jgi:hypothetical protein
MRLLKVEFPQKLFSEAAAAVVDAAIRRMSPVAYVIRRDGRGDAMRCDGERGRGRKGREREDILNERKVVVAVGNVEEEQKSWAKGAGGLSSGTKKGEAGWAGDEQLKGVGPGPRTR